MKSWAVIITMVLVGQTVSVYAALFVGSGMKEAEPILCFAQLLLMFSMFKLIDWCFEKGCDNNTTR